MPANERPPPETDAPGEQVVDVFSYPRHFFHQLAATHDLAAPIQIELHTGVHCDLYRCPHCYGFGQTSGNRHTASADIFLRALDDLPMRATAIIMSGVTTDPLTHSEAAEIIRGVRQRGFPLGLYTKGARLGEEVRRALVEPAAGADTWVTLSIDAANSPDYLRRHNIPPDSHDGFSGTSGADYFAFMCANLAALRRERDMAGSRTGLRAAFLLFDDSDMLGGDLLGEVRAAVERFAPLVDLMRFALPQNRNDGAPPGNLPPDAEGVLNALAREHRGDDAVRVLVETARPTRDTAFTRCRAQRYQVTIDRSGDVFPCPQVAAHPYRHLAVGNIATTPLREILLGEARRRLFALDVDADMKCRICDRKDEALNTELHALATAYGD